MKKFINIASWSTFIIGVFVIFSFTEGGKNKMLCNEFKVDVDWETGNHFVTEEGVKELIGRLGYTIGNVTMETIDADKVEQKLLDLSSVEEVSVFKNMNGVLNVKVKQRLPIARILNKNGSSTYIDDNGKLMPLSSKFTARVIVVNGNINENRTFSVEEIRANDSLATISQLDELYDLVTEFRKDEFFIAQFEQIYVEQNGEYTIIPKVGNQKIRFGKPTEVKEKLKKLKQFYTEGIEPQSLNLYSEINVEYNGQIVCTKK